MFLHVSCGHVARGILCRRHPWGPISNSNLYSSLHGFSTHILTQSQHHPACGSTQAPVGILSWVHHQIGSTSMRLLSKEASDCWISPSGSSQSKSLVFDGSWVYLGGSLVWIFHSIVLMPISLLAWIELVFYSMASSSICYFYSPFLCEALESGFMDYSPPGYSDPMSWPLNYYLLH